MAATGNGWHTVLHIEGHNEAGQRIMSTQKRRQTNDSVFRVEFNINDNRPRHVLRYLARIGTDPSCDIVLPGEFWWFACHFDVNPISGEVLLHASFDGTSKDRRRIADFRLKRWDDAQDEFKYDRVHVKTTDWAIVLHPDLSKGEAVEREYVLTIGPVELLIRPPNYGPGTYSPSPEILRYMKANFGNWDRPQHRHAVYKGKITNVPIRQLGRGGQGFVNHVVSTLNGCHFARKEINVETIPHYRARRDGRSFFDILLAEVNLLARLQDSKCNHVVQYFHTEGLDDKNAKLERNVIVYMDVYECSLSDMIMGGKFRNGEGRPLLMKMVKHMATAFSALSDIDAIHRDVKPENILYDGRSFHLTDFGLAKAMDDYATFVGTDAYRAPEVEKMIAHTPKVDIFSLGVTVAACLESMSPEAMLDTYRVHKLHWPEHVSGLLAVFGNNPLAALARESPNERPAAREVLDAVNAPNQADLNRAMSGMVISSPVTTHIMGNAGGYAQEHSFNDPMGEPFPPAR